MVSDTSASQREDAEQVDDAVVPSGRATLWVSVGILCAVAGVWIAPVGVVGMIAGSGAHLKGHRLGLPVAAVAAVTTVVGMALLFFTRLQ